MERIRRRFSLTGTMLNENSFSIGQEIMEEDNQQRRYAEEGDGSGNMSMECFQGLQKSIFIDASNMDEEQNKWNYRLDQGNDESRTRKYQGCQSEAQAKGKEIIIAEEGPIRPMKKTYKATPGNLYFVEMPEDSDNKEENYMKIDDNME
ncbi:hypothetical protein PIB30_080786 [Stylosanthes scabra]|uniref:Uncharacterized protein n=1 Tax=Stylosanthes scabra TaxID=79078 RepID=A0ABU6WPU5_9FABA|nr:hypothetical protein [Stylosanthes scabra]